MNDFGFDLKLRMDVANSLEQDNLARGARRKDQIEPGRPILSILLEFTQEKIQRVQERDCLEALRALGECRVVMADLAKFGHSEFAANIEIIDAGMARIAVAARELIVAKYLDPKTSAEDRQMILETLVVLIERGAWPDWQHEFAKAVERRSSLAPAS
jgi:hypothetical protein